MSTDATCLVPASDFSWQHAEAWCQTLLNHPAVMHQAQNLDKAFVKHAQCSCLTSLLLKEKNLLFLFNFLLCVWDLEPMSAGCTHVFIWWASYWPLNLTFYVYVYVYVCVSVCHVCRCLQRPKEGVRSWCWEPKLGPLKELLTATPPPQAPQFPFKCKNIKINPLIFLLFSQTVSV